MQLINGQLNIYNGLNLSGSTSFTGSVNITGSLQISGSATSSIFGKIGIGNTAPQSTLHIGPSFNTMPGSTSIAVPGDTSMRFMAGSDGNANYGSYIAGTQVAGIRALSLGYRQGAGDITTMTLTELTTGTGSVGIGTTSPTSVLTVNGSIAVLGQGAFTSDYTVPAMVTWLTAYSLSTTCVVTLPTPASNSGRMLFIRTQSAQLVNSASSNVSSLATGGVGNSILAATAGKWALLFCDGTYWNIFASN
jgi:hypothetical protein